MKAGVVTWNTAVKLALTFMMVSAFVVAYLF